MTNDLAPLPYAHHDYPLGYDRSGGVSALEHVGTAQIATPIGALTVPLRVRQIRYGRVVDLTLDQGHKNGLYYRPTPDVETDHGSGAGNTGSGYLRYDRRTNRLDGGLWGNFHKPWLGGLNADIIDLIETLNGIEPLPLSNVEMSLPEVIEHEGRTLVRQNRNERRIWATVVYRDQESGVTMTFGYPSGPYSILDVAHGDGGNFARGDLESLDRAVHAAFTHAFNTCLRRNPGGVKKLSFPAAAALAA